MAKYWTLQASVMVRIDQATGAGSTETVDRPGILEALIPGRMQSPHAPRKSLMTRWIQAFRSGARRVVGCAGDVLGPFGPGDGLACGGAVRCPRVSGQGIQ